MKMIKFLICFLFGLIVAKNNSEEEDSKKSPNFKRIDQKPEKPAPAQEKKEEVRSELDQLIYDFLEQLLQKENDENIVLIRSINSKTLAEKLFQDKVSNYKSQLETFENNLRVELNKVFQSDADRSQKIKAQNVYESTINQYRKAVEEAETLFYEKFNFQTIKFIKMLNFLIEKKSEKKQTVILNSQVVHYDGYYYKDITDIFDKFMARYLQMSEIKFPALPEVEGFFDMENDTY